ncbi:FtsX-like permease family protein, partial [Pseudomonas syringae pv. tagetis]|uniref:FtsX-like permease family protein n=1 Tax=Pseudomonas syringae group genomosp. 7 TaxID=251699 RepID=UPI0037705E97
LMLLYLGQTWLLAILTLLCSMPLGLMIAWCLDGVINVQAFGWRLPLQVSPMVLLLLFALAWLASLLAWGWRLLSLCSAR